MPARSRATARTAPVRTRRRRQARWTVLQLAPSRRSLLVGMAIAFVSVAAYFAALETSVFAGRTIRVEGGTPRIQSELRHALAPELGRSLLRVHAGSVSALAVRIPDVVAVSVD